ncbi:Activity-regulated cytoskeleton associated protein 1, partial [Frankliniella fusca]
MASHEEFVIRQRPFIMHPPELQTDELEYELTIRGVEAGAASREQKAHLFVVNERIAAKPEAIDTLNLEEELAALKTKLIELKVLVQECLESWGGLGTSQLPRVATLYLHCMFRNRRCLFKRPSLFPAFRRVSWELAKIREELLGIYQSHIIPEPFVPPDEDSDFSEEEERKRRKNLRKSRSESYQRSTESHTETSYNSPPEPHVKSKVEKKKEKKSTRVSPKRRRQEYRSPERYSTASSDSDSTSSSASSQDRKKKKNKGKKNSKKSKKKKRKSRRRRSSNSSNSGSSGSDSPEEKKYRMNPVTRFPHRFGKDGDVQTFLDDVEGSASIHRIGDEELLRGIEALLTGPAKEWHRANKSSLTSWKIFKRELKDAFEPGDEDDEVMEKIQRLKQNEDETFVVFESRCNLLFKRLSNPLTSKEKLRILLKGLHLYYRSKIISAKMESIRTLRDSCKELERDKSQIRELEREKKREEKRMKEKEDKKEKKQSKSAAAAVISSDDQSSDDAKVSAVTVPVKPEQPEKKQKGKRTRRPSWGSTVSVNVNRSPEHKHPYWKQKAIARRSKKLVLKVELGRDNRGYITSTVLGLPLKGLLDSGSQRTLVDKTGLRLLKAAGLKLSASKYSILKDANKGSSTIIGELHVPFSLEGKVKLVTVLYAPRLSNVCIFGLDFWRLFRLRPDFVEMTCEVGSATIEIIDTPQELKEDILTEPRRTSLDNLLEEFRPVLQPGKLGCIDVEHVIDTGDAQPVRSRYQNYNPKILKDVHAELDDRLRNGTVEASESPWLSPL